MPAAVQERKEFDKIVQFRDKQGNTTSENHYACHIIDGTTYFERPLGSGNLFEPSGVPCGRLVTRAPQKLDLEAEHVAFAAPVSGSEKLSAELSLAKSESDELRMELAALKAELELKTKIKDLEAKTDAKAAPVSGKFAAHAAEKKEV